MLIGHLICSFTLVTVKQLKSCSISLLNRVTWYSLFALDMTKEDLKLKVQIQEKSRGWVILAFIYTYSGYAQDGCYGTSHAEIKVMDLPCAIATNYA